MIWRRLEARWDICDLDGGRTDLGVGWDMQQANQSEYV